MQNYYLENVSEDDFEALVNTLCQRVLGVGTVNFAKGKDGGRDGRFEGMANYYPSKKENWQGKFIIQAKHTTDYNASCSDKPFFGNQSSIINGEIEKIKKLKAGGEIDCYLLFTNRKETENREDAVKYIKSQTGIQKADVVGKETIHSWIAQHKDIVKQFRLDRFSLPFDFYDKDIKELIVIFHDTIPDLIQNEEPTIERPDIRTKNKINDLDTSYYENVLLSDLNRYEKQILDFLQNPINQEYAIYYEETSVELKRVIETNRESFSNFKNVFDFLTRFLLEKEPEKLKKYRNTIPALFHFMYYNCDIGRNK